ncbi:hypothetical protein D3C84_992460 [compost metagenome]
MQIPNNFHPQQVTAEELDVIVVLVDEGVLEVGQTFNELAVKLEVRELSLKDLLDTRRHAVVPQE